MAGGSSLVDVAEPAFLGRGMRRLVMSGSCARTSVRSDA